MPILIDTSVLLAATFEKDRNHVSAAAFMRQLATRQEQPVVLLPVVIELFHIAHVRISYVRAVGVIDAVRQRFVIEPLIDDDFERVVAIQRQYLDAKLDFTDAAIFAVSERLKISRIATFDRRDFMIYRPSHVEHYDLLP